jgi:alkylglycerol monooxygenase
MPINLIALAIPVFLLSILGEAVVSRRKGLAAYRLADFYTSVGCGVAQQAFGVFFKALAVFAYAAVLRYAPGGELSAKSPGTWVLAFIGYDFLYYLWHRSSHRVNFIWATHVVHHQSEDYNLGVALRQAMFAGLTSLPFDLTLAMLGVPLQAYLISQALNLLYQFWIHTELVDRLPAAFEAVFNTPSHHRVHHAVNPRYLDKNYAGVFILWDRWLGTFTREDRRPVYGTVRLYRSFNPVGANFESWVELAKRARKLTRWQDRLALWVAPPEWKAAEELAAGASLEVPEPDPSAPKLRVSPSPRNQVLAASHFVLALSAALILLLRSTIFPLTLQGALLGTTLASLLAMTGWLEGRTRMLWISETALALALGLALASFAV